VRRQPAPSKSASTNEATMPSAMIDQWTARGEVGDPTYLTNLSQMALARPAAGSRGHRGSS